jgi:hypothetical protein
MMAGRQVSELCSQEGFTAGQILATSVFPILLVPPGLSAGALIANGFRATRPTCDQRGCRSTVNRPCLRNRRAGIGSLRRDMDGAFIFAADRLLCARHFAALEVSNL